MSNYFTDLELDVIKQMVGKQMEIAWRNAQDPFFLFVHSIYKDTGSRQRDTDHATLYIDRSNGELYDTSSSTALQAGKGFQDRKDIVTETVSLAYFSGHAIVDRHDQAKLKTILAMTDPVARMDAFTKAYGKMIKDEIIGAIQRRREGLVSTFMDGIESETAFGENIIKSVAAGTDIFAFVNLLSAAAGDAMLKATVNAFDIQTDQNGNRLGGQEIKWLFVNQNLADAKILMNIDLYVNLNYRNIASMSKGKFAVRYVAATPDDSSIALGDRHTIVMYGREEIPPLRVFEDAEGVQIVADDYAVIKAKCGISISKNTPSV